MMWLRTRLFADSGLLRRRGAAFLLALVIELLLALLLFFLAPPLPSRKEAPRTTVFGIEASKGTESADKKPAPKQRQKAARTEPRQEQTQPPPPPIPSPVELPPAPAGPPTFLKLSRNDYRQGDISKVPTHPSEAPTSDAPDPGHGRSDDSPVVGTAPNGEPLYAPGGWVRKPTDAELRPYWPSRGRNGTGTIACRTAPRNRLVDCRILGETPTGSGFGYSALKASWQFQMRPPRLDGKDQIGVWVVVTGTFTTTER